MTNDSYLKLKYPAETEIDIKKSRFIVNAIPISHTEEARAYILQHKQLTPSANHHCSAFIIGPPLVSQNFGYSDDGEPSGTAGKPMYQVLQGHNIGDICVVVTRFFGGIKLGTGGLARAYADSIKALLPLISLDEVLPTCELTLAYPYSLSSMVDTVLHSSQVTLVDSQYTDSVRLRVSIPIKDADQLMNTLQERGSGKILVSR